MYFKFVLVKPNYLLDSIQEEYTICYEEIMGYTSLTFLVLLQVIAREDKGETYGIDYKYSDMATSYSESANKTAAPASVEQPKPTQVKYYIY